MTSKVAHALACEGFDFVNVAHSYDKKPQAKACATHFSAALFPAAISLSRAICVQVRRRTGAIPTTPRRASSSTEIGGNPAVPSSEFTSARFSARSRATSSSSSNTYRDRNRRATQFINFCHIVLVEQASACGAWMCPGLKSQQSNLTG